MRLLEAILDANRRTLHGDRNASVNLAEFSGSLPLVALTCIDPRLNPLLPGALGIPEAEFIWLRNAGNIISEPMSSTVRSLALACAIKGGREIAIIGHTDCKARQITVLDLMERFKSLGIGRSSLPDNLNEFFGLFASERQNVIKGVDFVRRSPLIGAGIPVHGLLMDTGTGALEWISNGYDAVQAGVTKPPAPGAPVGGPLGQLLEFKLPEWKFPDVKIGSIPVAEKAAAAVSSVVAAEQKAGEVVRKVEEAVEAGQEAVHAAGEIVQAGTQAVAELKLKTPPLVPRPPALPRKPPFR
jgi:carbonic anhydrase